MKVRQFALSALSAIAFAGLSQTSDAAVLFNITGGVVPSVSYGAAAGDNNVINDTNWTPAQQTALTTGSTIYDGSAGSLFRGSTAAINSMVSVSGLSSGQQYTIAWLYAGSESANTDRFIVPNAANVQGNSFSAPGFAEDNSNNNLNNLANRLAGTVFMGTTSFVSGGATDIPAFTLSDDLTGAAVRNGGTNAAPGAHAADLIFSYATFSGGKFTLTDTPSLYIVFAFNDNGSSDIDHDDFVGVAAILAGGSCQCELAQTPLPAALPLFSTGLGALGLFAWRRKRKSIAA